MVVRTISASYEQSSESGRERMLPVPYARLHDATPAVGDPACILGLIPGTEKCGTVISIHAGRALANLNVARGAIYRHNVRNVLTYNAGNEATWGPINIGDPVFYDPSATMPAGVYLSTSPLDNTGAANSLFGHVVMQQDETAADFPRGTALAGFSDCFAVLQH